MARTKTTARLASSFGAQPSASAPPPPLTSAPPSTSVHPQAAPPQHNYAWVYQWAPLHLLAETSAQLPNDHLTNLLSSDTDKSTYALDREDYSHLNVCIPPRGMPICVDDRANNEVPFTFIYSAIFKRLRLRLPFTFFEKDLFTELNVAPCKLHPNAWAFIRAFEILCNHFGHPPSTDVFPHFFEAKNPGDRSWVSLNGVSG